MDNLLIDPTNFKYMAIILQLIVSDVIILLLTGR